MSSQPFAGVDPAATVVATAAGVSASQPFAEPVAAERQDAGVGLARLAIGDISGAVALLAPLGFTVTADVDPATGRRYAMAVCETATPRAWGVYLVDLSQPLELCVAVPHPKSDALCEHLALRLWRAVPGSMLAMAAVHRDAADGTADQARDTASIFHHLWVAVLGPRGVPQVQIHGFANATAPEQVVVSTGAGPVTPAAVRIADEIAATGLVTTRSWDGTADPDLRATTNQQGIAAAAKGWVWVHVEHNRTVRDTPALWEPAVDAVAAANPALLAYDRPSPGGPDHAPRPVGADGATGTSRFFAREDHAHAAASPRVMPVPAGTTIAPDASRGDWFRVLLDVDAALMAPVYGLDGQSVLVEVRASGADRVLTLDASILLSTAVASPITIPADRRWFCSLVCVRGAGWFAVAAALQT